MLLRGIAQDHSHEDVVALCKSHILVGEIVVGMSERRGNYMRGATAEPKTKKSLGRFVKVTGKCQTFIDRGVGGPQDYRMPIHMVHLHRTGNSNARPIYCPYFGTCEPWA